jgi:hypothetical protein
MSGLTWLAKAGDLLDKLDKTAAETIAAAGDDDDFDDDDVDGDIARMLRDDVVEDAQGEGKTDEAEGHDDAHAKDGDASNKPAEVSSQAKANSRDPVSK